MKTSQRIILAGIAALVLTTTAPVSAIEGLKLQIRCPDVVLSWPSTNGETYIVQYRATLDTNSVWQTLTNYMPPASGINMTFFIHSNRVDCPPGQVLGMMLSSSNSDGAPITKTISLTAGERLQLKQTREEARLTALYEKCKQEGREPYEWELKNQPPLPPSPEEVRAKILKARENQIASRSDATVEEANDADGSNDPHPEDGGGGGGFEPATGFYRVVRNGIHLFGLTNGTLLRGVVDMPIEIGANIVNSDVLLFAAGDNPAHSEVRTNSQGQLVMNWNTHFVPNGTYLINLEATADFDLPATQSSAKSVTVDNDIWFTDFTTSFGYQMWILAFLKTQNADYEVALSDGQSGQYLYSFFDSTTDGTINFLWNLQDSQGNVATNASFQADFYLSQNGGAYTNAGSMFFIKENTGIGDQFLIARAENFNFNHPAAYDNYHSVVYHGAVDILGNPAADDTYILSPGNISLADSTFHFTADTKTDFLNYLTNSAYQNFFWWGHGNENGIGFGIFDDEENRIGRVGMFANEVAAMLGNGPTIRRHPYRLTFIHGCNAAKSRKWSNAFGIPREAVSTAHFQAKGVKARAFISNTGLVPSIAEQSQLFYAESLAQFHSLWMQDYPLSYCLHAATNAPLPWETRIPLPTVAESNAFWVIYGAQNLSRYGP